MERVSEKPTVVVAGARGFVGEALVPLLAQRFNVIGLSRRAHPDRDTLRWRACDLFSRKNTRHALEDADYAVYLVHSMLPSARLTQGRFEDMDLLCADNFARAAHANGVRHIVYLGGIVPDGDDVSRHLTSRREVERALAAYGTPVTSLRAGLVLGPNGSSTAIVTRLVEKLPVMLCPTWTRMQTQPIALSDIVTLIDFVLGNPDCASQTYDVGGPDVVPYKELMAETAQILGLKRRFYDVPFVPPGLSTAWVSAITGAPMELVGPLVESLEHRMVASDDRLARLADQSMTPLDQALRAAVAPQEIHSEPVAFDKPGASNASEKRVRSVQRLPLPPGKDAAWVAEEYARWLPQFMHPLIRVEVKSATMRFYFLGMSSPLLVLERDDVSRPDRQLFWIRGGLLSQPTPGARLEFREVLGGEAVLAAIHDFEPRLPWYLYRHSQAVAHLWVMHGFAKHLARY